MCKVFFIQPIMAHLYGNYLSQKRENIVTAASFGPVHADP
jgi:hypothetical protein